MTETQAPDPAPARRRDLAAWALFAAFALHNLEEALTMGAFLRGPHDGVLAALGLGEHLLAPFLVAVTAVTILGLVLAVLGTGRTPKPWAQDGLRILAWILLLNVVAPHVPAAILAGGYAPGVVTALLLNLPAAVWLLRVSRGERRGRARPLA